MLNEPERGTDVSTGTGGLSPVAVDSNDEAILIAYIPGEIGEAALDAGLNAARSRSCRAVLVNAPRAGRTVDRKMIDDKAKAELVDRARSGNVELQVVQPIDDDPVAAIEDLADSGAFSLLVIGLRRRSSIGKFIMGSTAQRLLLDVDIPVLSIKARRQS